MTYGIAELGFGVGAGLVGDLHERKQCASDMAVGLRDQVFEVK